MDIVYIKLMNGDELFARCIGEENGMVFLDDVMLMETIMTNDEAVKYLFMSRYSPYGIRHSMSIDRAKIVFIHEVTETVKAHYEMSVKYAEKIIDEKIQEGIATATKHLSAILKKQQKRHGEEIIENVQDQVLSRFFTDTSTKH